MAKNRPCPCGVVCARGFGRGVEAARLRGELRGAHVFHRRRHVSAAARARRSARRGKRRGLLCPVPPGARRSATRRGVRLLSRGDPRGIAAVAAFFAGTVGVLGLMLVAPPLAKVALSFSSPEYFALMALGLAMVVLLAGRSMVKALLAMLLGLWIAGIGTDLFSTTSRFTFGRMELLSGVDFVVVAIGVFAIGEVLANMEARDETRLLPVPKGLRNLLPTV